MKTPALSPEYLATVQYPAQAVAIDTLERAGFRFVCWFNAHNPEDENAQCATMQRASRIAPSNCRINLSCEVDTDGTCNGKSVADFLATAGRRA